MVGATLASVAVTIPISTVVQLAVNDYVELQAFHTATAALNVGPSTATTNRDGADFSIGLVGVLSDPLKVDKDAVNTAATRLVQNMLVAGDAQPAFKIGGDGTISWGVGGATAPDTSLYRNGANSLLTSSEFIVYNNAFTSLRNDNGAALTAAAQGAGHYNFVLGNDGSMEWGSPTTAADVNLYRSAASVININDLSGGGGQFSFDTSGGGGYPSFYIAAPAGSAGQTGAWLDFNGGNAASHWALFTENDIEGIWFWGQTPGVVAALTSTELGFFKASNDGEYVFQIGKVDGKLSWGPGGGAVTDTFMYRNGARALGSNASFSNTNASVSTFAFTSVVDGDTNYRWYMQANGSMGWGPGNAGADTIMYRWYSNALYTNGDFGVGKAFRAYHGSLDTAFYTTIGGDAFGYRFATDTNGKMSWSSGAVGADLNLYRAAAGVLKTDYSFATGAYGTSLPASPVDGQVYTLVDSTTNPTYQWTFRYNASSTSAYKWEYIGGTPVHAYALAQEGIGASTGWQDSATILHFIVPRAGEYEVIGNARAYANPASLVHMGIAIGAASPNPPYASILISGAGGYGPLVQTVALAGLAAGNEIRMRYAQDVGSALLIDSRSLIVTPRRVS
jgi:hypothetical protein